MTYNIARAILMALSISLTAQAQSGGFVVKLGADTIQVESFSTSGNITSGTVVTRAPSTRIVRWSLARNNAGGIESYEQSLHDGHGAAITTGLATAKMRFRGDSVVRETSRAGQPSTQSFAVPAGTVPLLGSSVVLFGNSWLAYELGFASARRNATGNEGRMLFVGTGPTQLTPQATRVWIIGTDSMEADYFGVARSGYRFDRDGKLLRADWINTTYKYKVERVASVDADRIAKGWADAEAAGKGIGVISPRESSQGTVGTANVQIDYGRPARRGRTIWGDVVPWNAVWRLGADLATTFRTDADLTIGTAAVPAGTYSLFMLPTPQGAQLIVNSQSGQFGTQYSAARDLVRVPLERRVAPDMVERLTIGVRDGRLWIEWGDASYSVEVRVK